MVSIPKSSRSSQYVVWGTALIILALAVYALHTMTREKVPVRVAQVVYQDLELKTPTNGKVEPVDDFRERAQTDGQITDVYVHAGERVKAGQLLLKMDDASALAALAHAQATLQQAEAAANNMQHGGTLDERNSFAADLSRAKLQLQTDEATLAADQRLLQSGADSSAEVAAAQHRIDMDNNAIRNIEQRRTERYGQADVAATQAQVADAKAAVASAQTSYSNADIRTPISGTVYYLPVSRYDFVDAKDDLVSVADLNHLRITAYFDEPEIGNLAVGQKVNIEWQAHPDKIWHGHISQVPTTIISYGTRNVGECYITVDDADGVLQPDANVTVTVIIAQHPHVLTVPREALHFDSAQAYVFQIKDGRLVRTPVRKGIINNNWAEIVSGLSEGDAIVVNATTNRDLYPGLRVNVQQ